MLPGRSSQIWTSRAPSTASRDRLFVLPARQPASRQGLHRRHGRPSLGERARLVEDDDPGLRQALQRIALAHQAAVLLHQPYNDYYGAWRDLERALSEGLVRAIGVSNFDAVRLLDICTFAKVAPALNQVETHVFWQQAEAHANMEALGVQHMAWGPFAEGANDFFHNPLLAEIGAKHGKGVGQVALRYLIDAGVVVIPKSTRPERMAENIDVFGFELTPEDKAAIAELDTRKSVCYDHTDLNVVGGLLGFIKSSM